MVKKNKKLKQNIELSEEAIEIKRLIIILIGVLIFVVGIYFLSQYIVNKREDSSNNIVEGKINYDVVSVGTLLNRPYEEYYVLVFDQEDDTTGKYSTLASSYSQKEDAIKIYTCDLANKLNKDYKSKSDKGNNSAKTTSEFSFGKITLLKINNGQITEYNEDYDTIKDILKTES